MVTVQRLRTVVRLLICLVTSALLVWSTALRLAAQSAAISTQAQVRQEEARRFLNSRSVLHARAARHLIEARETERAMKLKPNAKSAYAPALLSQPWKPLGPNQVSTSAYGLVTGRVTGISVDPSDSTGNTVYLGTTGGVFGSRPTPPVLPPPSHSHRLPTICPPSPPAASPRSALGRSPSSPAAPE